MILNVLKDVLAIEWRDEKDDAVLHQILLCLKALSTTDVTPSLEKQTYTRPVSVTFPSTHRLSSHF